MCFFFQSSLNNCSAQSSGLHQKVKASKTNSLMASKGCRCLEERERVTEQNISGFVYDKLFLHSSLRHTRIQLLYGHCCLSVFWVQAIPFLLLFGKHPWCSGLSPSLVLRDCAYWCSGYHMGLRVHTCANYIQGNSLTVLDLLLWHLFYPEILQPICYNYSIFKLTAMQDVECVNTLDIWLSEIILT